MKAQLTLEGESVLDFRIRESVEIIRKAMTKASLTPLILNFSGGKDSHVLLDLVQRMTDNFYCFYMESGIEFKESVAFAKEACAKYGRPLLTSCPSDYVTEKYPKNGFFERLSALGYFPRPGMTWCSIYLKIRPQVRKLRKLFGRRTFFKLNGVRRAESSRRMQIYRETSKKGYITKDSEDSKSFMVFPILNWTDSDIKQYIERKTLVIPPNPLYQRFGVSGCAWCAFYGPKIYERIIRQEPNLYDKFIQWEEKLNRPSVLGNHWLRDIKQRVA